MCATLKWVGYLVDEPEALWGEECPLVPSTFVVGTRTRCEGGHLEVPVPELSGPLGGGVRAALHGRQQAIVEEYLAIRQLPGVVGGDQLQPVETATTVRVQNGETLLTDGPFIDAKEHLGGYLVIETADLDAALEIAARIPAARMGGAVEVRPLVER